MRCDSLDKVRKDYSSGLERRVSDALDALAKEGLRVSFYAVAQRSGVSRSSLYRCGNLRKLVEDARESSTAGQDVSSENAKLRRRVAQLEDALALQRGMYAHRWYRNIRLPELYAVVRLTA